MIPVRLSRPGCHGDEIRGGRSPRSHRRVRHTDNNRHDVATGTDLATVDNVMTAFMEKYSVPGLSLAITKDERLVYLKAYGLADGGDAEHEGSLPHRERVEDHYVP